VLKHPRAHELGPIRDARGVTPPTAFPTLRIAVFDTSNARTEHLYHHCVCGKPPYQHKACLLRLGPLERQHH